MTRKHIDLGYIAAALVLSLLAIAVGTRIARMEARAAAEEENRYIASGGVAGSSYLTGPAEMAGESLIV